MYNILSDKLDFFNSPTVTYLLRRLQMHTFQQDFKEAIEKLCEEHKYHVDYTPLPADPEVCLIARIRGGRSGRRVEVYPKAKGCKVIIPETDIEKTFKKNELNLVIDCIKDFIENPLTAQ